ncbi:SDR family NAD(P)-dependent oxidoreductase [Aestuariicoccus sp. MJ-SS9]|uniref:SDR family NAD(P)-dependent oxidoreductase n=1 Tax=Aestuariicoccus sp. MJ-SS9 TaxID=3079855 RepID=UPI0029156F8A|nr:SDR family NAD(P)-dependent oxidoreductase [Aestuariicoccus sp. MJ-SS9]MDU8912166.1 SDR family NAD(P)-dependent oxidoreductase [Aestuariicoccus sp. MJ-SS9]
MSTAGTWLITGATRGIGLAVTAAHLARGGSAIATHRAAPGAALDALAERHGGRLRLLAWDLRQPLSATAAEAVCDGPLEVLFGNAAIYGPRGLSFPGGPDYDGLKDAFDVNALGVIRMVEAFVPHMEGAANPRIVAVTSLMGTAAKAGPKGLGYRISKAALNMAMQVIAAELQGRHIATACLRPGHVRTDMGGPNGAIAPEESAAALLAVTDALSYRPAPQFLDLTGEPLAW